MNNNDAAILQFYNHCQGLEVFSRVAIVSVENVCVAGGGGASVRKSGVK